MSQQEDRRYHFMEPTPEDEQRYADENAAATRACRVRGRMLPLAGALTSLLICMLTPAWYGVLAEAVKPSACLVFGVLFSLFAIPLHLLGGSRDIIRAGWVKSLLYGVGILLNTAGTSLCMAAYYIHLGGIPSVTEAVAVMAVAALLYGAAALFMQLFPDRHGAVTAAVTLAAAAGGIVSAVFWIRNGEKTLWSLGFFLLLWVVIDLIALHASCCDGESPWLRFASFASFGLLMTVAAVVLIILACAAGSCDCDCGSGDCCDCGGGGNGKGKGRRRGK